MKTKKKLKKARLFLLQLLNYMVRFLIYRKLNMIDFQKAQKKKINILNRPENSSLDLYLNEHEDQDDLPPILPL